MRLCSCCRGVGHSTNTSVCGYYISLLLWYVISQPVTFTKTKATKKHSKKNSPTYRVELQLQFLCS